MVRWPGTARTRVSQRRATRVRSWDIDWKPERLSVGLPCADLFALVAAMLARGEPPPGAGRARIMRIAGRYWPERSERDRLH